jgi:hypothetical protein
MATTIRTDIPSQAPLLGEIIETPVRYAKKLNKSNGGTGVPMVYIDGAKVFAQVGGRLTSELTSNETSPARRAELMAQLPTIRTTFHLAPVEEQKYPSPSGKLPLFVKLPNEQTQQAQSFDERIKKDIVDLTPSWFAGKTMSSEMVDNVYLPLVRLYPPNPEVPDHEKDLCVKLSIYEGANAREEVEVLVQEPGDYTKFRIGSIHDLQRNSPIIFVFQYKGLWFNNKGTEVGPNASAPRILVLHQPSSTAVPTFNTEPGVEFEIIQPFNPVPTAAAGNDSSADGTSMETTSPLPAAAQEQTIIDGGNAAYPAF